MGQTYSEGENMIAAQMAYLDFDGYEGMSVEDVIKAIESRYNNNPNPDAILQKQKDCVDSIKEIAKKTGTDGWQNWTIEKVCNDNGSGGSGYYGALISTGEENGKKNGIIVSRGTEPDVGTERAYADILENDYGLLDSDGTSQEKRAAQFAEDIWYEYGDKYNGFDLSGHSLGGHLAMYMAIAAPAAMRNKINHITSYDGPGFSDELIKKYEKQIAELRDRMTHYKYTIIGSCLSELPGVERITIASETDSFPDSHSIKNLRYKDGKLVETDPSGMMNFVEWLSKFLDGDMKEFKILDIIGKFCGPLVQVPVSLLKTVCKLIKTLATVFREAREILNKVVKFIDDIKYKYFKPKVSGDYEISFTAITSIQRDINSQLKSAYNSAEEAYNILNSLRSSWTGCAYIKSSIKWIIVDICGDIDKLKKMNAILDSVRSRYQEADSSVEGLFA